MSRRAGRPPAVRAPTGRIARPRPGIPGDGIALRFRRILAFFQPIFEDSFSMPRAPKAIVP
jgi:hypothetical protein